MQSGPPGGPPPGSFSTLHMHMSGGSLFGNVSAFYRSHLGPGAFGNPHNNNNSNQFGDYLLMSILNGYATAVGGGGTSYEHLSHMDDLQRRWRRHVRIDHNRKMTLWDDLVYSVENGHAFDPFNRILDEVVVTGKYKQSNVGQDYLDPSTVGRNFLGLSYPGPNNPMTYAGKPDYTTIPKVWSEYPAIGHDRSYDKLGITGAGGVLLDQRALPADLVFIAQQNALLFHHSTPPFDRVSAGLFGFGMGVAIIPKMVTTFTTPVGINNFLIGATITSNVNNIPSK